MHGIFGWGFTWKKQRWEVEREELHNSVTKQEMTRAALPPRQRLHESAATAAD